MIDNTSGDNSSYTFPYQKPTRGDFAFLKDSIRSMTSASFTLPVALGTFISEGQLTRRWVTTADQNELYFATKSVVMTSLTYMPVTIANLIHVSEDNLNTLSERQGAPPPLTTPVYETSILQRSVYIHMLHCLQRHPHQLVVGIYFTHFQIRACGNTFTAMETAHGFGED